MTVRALDAAGLAALAEAHPAWTIEADRAAMARTVRFADFSAAFAFMTRVAMLAEAQDHHPEWSNVYATVTIRLTTHDAGGLSARDARLAAAIDRLLGPNT